MSAVEPILQENKDRFVIFPFFFGIKNKKLVFGLLKKLTCIKILLIGKRN